MEPVDIAVISAAGTGSRLGVGMPKCLVAIEGRSILERQLDLLDDISDVRVVVGYREQEVIRQVRARRPDAIIVRNVNYAETLTLASIHLAVRHVDRPFLAIDGDLVLEPVTFAAFRAAAAELTPLVAICASTTDDAVYVQTTESSDMVTAFQREPQTSYEWTGLAAIRREDLTLADGHVFRALEPGLPLRAHVIEAFEVDTPEDLDRAREAVGAWEQADSIDVVG